MNRRTRALFPGWAVIGLLLGIFPLSARADFGNWSTVYDGLGRRVQTTFQPMNSGTDSGPSSYLQYYDDPEQGCGGLENEINEAGSYAETPVNNLFGDTLGTEWYYALNGSANWATETYGLPLGGYGPELGTD